MVRILISGSVAYDRIMDFDGFFRDHFLPEKLHTINVSFSVAAPAQEFGGTAGNIAYTLALLEEKASIIATVGSDFSEYRKHLDATGIDASLIAVRHDLPTASAYIMTDRGDNQIAAFSAGAGALALSIMNNFTDVVSYVRLFAVGLAGVAISDTVNALAASLGAGSPIIMAFILFIGHTINIVLGPVSVMVHGVRLNVLEFSGHAGLSWSGTAYKPLKT